MRKTGKVFMIFRLQCFLRKDSCDVILLFSYQKFCVLHSGHTRKNRSRAMSNFARDVYGVMQTSLLTRVDSMCAYCWLQLGIIHNYLLIVIKYSCNIFKISYLVYITQILQQFYPPHFIGIIMTRSLDIVSLYQSIYNYISNCHI